MCRVVWRIVASTFPDNLPTVYVTITHDWINSHAKILITEFRRCYANLSIHTL
ncbi:MAG: hypothetical protein H6Q38_415 [Chloroflexi bacterium]|nr:hypothetical protein [Chloroflexota bacterium]